MLGEGSQTAGIGSLSVEQMSIVGDIRYVRQIGILNVVDLYLGIASSSCELSYFLIFVPENTRVENIWMKVDITTTFEVNMNDKGQGTKDFNM